MAMGDIVALSIATFHDLVSEGTATLTISDHTPGAADQ
jgi:hypothetical protein